MANLREEAEALYFNLKGPSYIGAPVDYIESILKSVVEEAILDDRMKRTADDLYRLSRSAGKAEGLELGAKRLDSLCDQYSGGISFNEIVYNGAKRDAFIQGAAAIRELKA